MSQEEELIKDLTDQILALRDKDAQGIEPLIIACFDAVENMVIDDLNTLPTRERVALSAGIAIHAAEESFHHLAININKAAKELMNRPNLTTHENKRNNPSNN